MKNDDSIFHPTLFEKLIVFSHLPFTFGVFLFAFFIGPLGNFLFYFVLSGNATDAFFQTFFSASVEGIGLTRAVSVYWYSLAGNLLWYTFLFYVAFLVRYLRGRLIQAKPELIALAPDGETDVRRIFRIVSMTAPQLVIMIIFLLVYATSVPDMLGKGELTVLSTPVFLFRSLLRSILFGSVLWLFGAGLWSLSTFGRLRLNLKSYFEDSMLGTRELGSLSSAFSIPYFLGLALFTGQMTLGGFAGQSSLVNTISLLILIPMGIILFIAPLVSTHRRMLEAKNVETAVAEKQMAELIGRIRETGEEDDRNVIRLLLLETVERKTKGIKTWPIDNQLIERLAIIATSVTAVLLAQIILTFLHL